MTTENRDKRLVKLIVKTLSLTLSASDQKIRAHRKERLLRIAAAIEAEKRGRF